MESSEVTHSEYWRETESSWIDLRTGLEWSKEFKSGINHYDSEKWAASQNKHLPTQTEFIEAEKNGIRELPNMVWKGYWFWSSTLCPGYSVYAYEFSGYDGNADVFYHRDDSDSYFAARAVSEVKKNEAHTPHELTKTEEALELAWEANR